MKRKEIAIEIISSLFILLFLYAAVSKIIDYDRFNVELRKSPVFIDIAGYVSWAIPAVEICIALLLLTSRTRYVGIVLSFFLMCLFTFYIIAILGFSEFIPCTCGGVLQKMSWNQHLVFNLFFVALAIFAIGLEHQSRATKLFTISFTALSSLFIVSGLYALTYDDSRKYSTFDVLSLKNNVYAIDSVDLGYNSYYFAGQSAQSLFLGNNTAPLNIVEIGCTLKTSQSYKVTISGQIDFNKPDVKVFPPYFFLLDGETPKLLRGDFKDLIAVPLVTQKVYFDAAIPLTKNSLAVRFASVDEQNELGHLEFDKPFGPKQDLLRKQVDGKFCVDGMMLYNNTLKELIYVYYYRDQFIVMDSVLNRLYYGATIDTIHTAKIKVSSFKAKDKTTTSLVPIVTVNSLSFTAGKFLFINSKIQGKNENKEVFNRSLRIDTYNLEDGLYVGSFYLSNPNAIRDIRMIDRNLFVLKNNILKRYDMSAVLEELSSIVLQKSKHFTGQ